MRVRAAWLVARRTDARRAWSAAIAAAALLQLEVLARLVLNDQPLGNLLSLLTVLAFLAIGHAVWSLLVERTGPRAAQQMVVCVVVATAVLLPAWVLVLEPRPFMSDHAAYVDALLAVTKATIALALLVCTVPLVRGDKGASAGRLVLAALTVLFVIQMSQALGGPRSSVPDSSLALELAAAALLAGAAILRTQSRRALRP